MDIMSLFLHLFNISISASAFALAIVLFRFIFKKSPKWLVVALWALVAVRLILPFSIESAMSLIPSKEVIPQEIFTVDTDTYSNTSFGFIENPAYSEYFNSTVTVDNVKAFQRDFEFAAYIWLIGVGFMLLYALVSYIRLRRTVRSAIPQRDGVWLCDSVKSPFILGVFRPRIYLPSDMDEATAELVLKHEKAHLKRRDHLWKPLGFVLLAVYWFNPVLWLSYVLLCRDIELACDERVIRDMEASDKKAYSEALLTCSVGHRMISACPVAFGEVGVKKRIKSVLNYKKPAFWFIIVAVVVSVVLALCFMTDPKGVNGGNVTYNGVDMIKELYFDMDEIISSAAVYTVYDGNSTTDYYFETPKDNYFCSVEIYNFLYDLTVSTIVDGEVNPMHEPQVNGVIKMSLDNWDVSVIFHDDFQKMYMERFKVGGVSVRSKDYAVEDPEEAKKFFAEKPYLDDYRIWEYNPASSAFGDGQIIFWLDSKYKINGKIKGEGKISKITNETMGVEGVSWSPEIVNNPAEYNIEIPVICDGEERVLNLTMTMVGKRGLASYYIIYSEDLMIEENSDGYIYKMKPVYSVDSAKWMYNPTYSDHLSIVVPNGYKIKSAVVTSGTTKVYDFFSSWRGEQVSWTPDKISEDAVLVITAEKNGRRVKFTLGIKFLEYFPAGERMSYEITPVNCWIHEETDDGGILKLEEKPQQDEGIIWYYNPFAGATGWYLTDYIFPEGYEIKSAEASNGAIQVENRFYGDEDGEKKVIWTPDFYENETPPAETDMVITALKDGKEIQFKLKVTLVSGAEGYALNTFKITPVNCKLTEEGWATFLLEEK